MQYKHERMPGAHGPDAVAAARKADQFAAEQRRAMNAQTKNAGVNVAKMQQAVASAVARKKNSGPASGSGGGYTKSGGRYNPQTVDPSKTKDAQALAVMMRRQRAGR